MIDIRDTISEDVEAILGVCRRTGVFTPEELEVAREVLEDAMDDGSTYRSLTAFVDGRVVGYILYGETPMTRGTYDLYWMAVEPSHQGQGIGRKLISAMEARIISSGARIVRVETSSLPEYEATRRFYEAVGYPEVSRIQDFYWPGNDLCTHVKRMDRVS